MSLPRCTGQIPIYYNPSPAARSCNGYYGKDKGINYHDCDGTPMYRFGYGLSYSKFRIDNIKADKTEITLDELKNGGKLEFKLNLRNLSNIDGCEVVQLYIRDKTASMVRPLRELKGYKKVTVSADDTENVLLEIGFAELGFYNAYGKFVVETGEFDIFIGNDCYADKAFSIRVI